MVVYSYLCGEVRETLSDHVSNALKFYRSLDNSLFVRNVNVKLLRNFEFKEIVEYTVIFHDIGKVFYQENFISKNCLSFVGHEFLSTLAFEFYVEELVKNNVLSTESAYIEFKYPILFSILYHHHAMGYSLRLRRLSKIRVNRGLVEASIENDVPQIVEPYVSKEKAVLQQRALRNVLHVLMSNVSEVFEEIHSIGVNLWRQLEINPKLKKLALATLTTLIILDYLSAYKGRKGPKLRFYRVLEQHYKILKKITANPMG